MKNIEYINKLITRLKGNLRGIRGGIQRQEMNSNDVIKHLKSLEELIEEIESQLDKNSMRHG
jgi:hypothetical protein